MLIKKLNLDEYKRIVVVPDLHGNFDILEAFMIEFGFNEDDFIISLGDLIDRGIQNIECLSFFIHTQNAIGVIGNHEKMAYDSMVSNSPTGRALWYSNGGYWSAKYNELYIKGIIKSYFEISPYVLEVKFNKEKYVFCHAELPCDNLKDIENSNEFKNKLIWSRGQLKNDKCINKIKDVKASFHGHTIVEDTVNFKNRFWLDCGAYRADFDSSNFLNVMVINKNQSVDNVKVFFDEITNKYCIQ
jgi:serine/threonine protein phosphatase 1